MFDRARDKAAEEVRSARDQVGLSGVLPLEAQYDTRRVPPELVESVKRELVATIIVGTGARRARLGRSVRPDSAAAASTSPNSLADQEHELSSLRSTLIYGGTRGNCAWRP